MAKVRLPANAAVLDVGTGTGVVAIQAARDGAPAVTGIDVSRRAIACCWLNSRLSGVRVELVYGDLHLIGARQFDLVLANPPYVPSAGPPPSRGRARSWDGGPTGRHFLDRLCAGLPNLLRPGGVGLVVHSALCGIENTMRRLQHSKLSATVVAQGVVPFGPVLRRRAEWLSASGLLAPGQRVEELVVIRAEKTC